MRILNLNGFAIMPAVAISSAVSAMAVQNLGAGHTMFSMVNGMSLR